ncbi:MAG: hypothetical protein ABJB05_07755 [Parafilimonas sp.]
MKHYFLFLLMLAISCNKELHNDNVNNNIQAELIYSGDVAVDGCDWMVVVDDTVYYHPDFLPQNLKENGTSVLVSFNKTKDSFYCGIAKSAFDIIHILSIKPE